MITRRIIPCLDIRNGQVVKGVNFEGVKEIADPVSLASYYNESGADELVFYDITASYENRGLFTDVLRRVAERVFIPLTVGGGIKDLKSAAEVLNAGANRVSVSSAAFRKPEIIPEIIKEFGVNALTVAIDVDVNPKLPSGYEVYIDGGRTATGADAIEWAKQVDGYGVNVILPTSKAGDGAKTGYDLPVIKAMAQVCKATIVASGGAGKLEHLLDAVKAGATVLLAASVFHFHMIDIGELKAYLKANGVAVR
ncbi:MAG: imidazole glycerol phosphate synthase subunit HisF [Oscillospiraceae bacterium]|nr:imidazole glycerol phosphate synthase subunit HisF [Oscillospiraceae bacterium]